ncbi:hypothetical protein HNY73_005495 [Argiope bruennichi]|uniref:Capsid protein n=1 Tax=Argiope bruennichi TaxID=94029 RepID=A0A8T0FGP7_ARGBR|nr:hypothetical protein HNY73_005495 [Argiope bruennichi]
MVIRRRYRSRPGKYRSLNRRRTRWTSYYNFKKKIRRKRMIKRRRKTCCNVVTLYATLNDKTTTTAWDTMPRSEKDGWKWESLPTALEAHCSNVMTQNLFNTYKYKMLKKMVVSFRQIARAYDVIQNYSIVGDTTKKATPTAKMSTQATTLMASRDLSFYAEKGTRNLDLKGTTRNFRNQKTGKHFTYTWYPGCREAISRTYNEMVNSKLLNSPFANDTTIGYGLDKAPTQAYAKQVEFAQTFTTKFEITVKTYWSMWTLLKKPVKAGVTFENLSINDNEFYGPFGIMSPYPGVKAAEIRKVYVDADDLILKMIDVENIEYRIGEFTINRK